MIAAIVGAQPGKYNYFAEMETAGKCLDWVKNHLALDEIGIYLRKSDVTEAPESIYVSLYDYLSKVISEIPPGAGGVLFTPWLHGNRCPFEDADASGMFFNIRLETGKTELIRAVVEGVCYHLRWMLECEDKKIKTSDPIRFAGGGALSDVTDQILSDITGRAIEVVPSPQNVGAVGAAATEGVGLGLMKSIEEVSDYIPVEKKFTPNPDNKPVYDRNYRVFCELHRTNEKLFHEMNRSAAANV